MLTLSGQSPAPPIALNLQAITIGFTAVATAGEFSAGYSLTSMFDGPGVAAEVIYDPVARAFTAKYATSTAVTNSPGNVTFSIVRTNGWPAGVTVQFLGYGSLTATPATLYWGGLPPNVYATLAQFNLIALPNKATINIAPNSILEGLVNASSYMDTAFAGAPTIVMPLVPAQGANPWPGVLVQCCIAQTRLWIMDFRGWDPGAGNDERIRESAYGWDKWLDQVNKGPRVLFGVQDSSVPAGTYSTPQVTSRRPQNWLCGTNPSGISSRGGQWRR